MRIQIIAVGEKMPAWVQQGYNEYIKRIGSEMNIELVEITAEKRGKSADLPRIMQKEAERMSAAIGKNHRVIALDRTGQSWSTEQLAQHLEGCLQDGSNISLLVGGPEGMSDDLLKKAHLRLSLSAMTFPHPVVRIILAEQLYRAYAILNHHPYHK